MYYSVDAIVAGFYGEVTPADPGYTFSNPFTCNRCNALFSLILQNKEFRTQRPDKLRVGLLHSLRRHGCYLKREGRAHSLWWNPTTGAVEAVPRHSEIPDRLARRICRNLSVPEVGRE